MCCKIRKFVILKNNQLKWSNRVENKNFYSSANVICKTDMNKEIEKSIPLLNEAVNRFLELGHSDIWDSDFYTDELGMFCK